MIGVMADDITVIPTGAALGAEIGGIDLSVPPDADRFAAILAAWHSHLVLLFRGQHISDEAFLDFSRRLGTLDLAPITVTGIIFAARMVAIGLTLFCPAYFGAEPCVGSNTANLSPIFPEHANPNPPTIWAHRSEIISPYKLGATST